MATESQADPAPWVRRADEHPRRFEAFALYRDAGPSRSLAAVARALGKSTGLLERWSSEDGWIHRVMAWDAYGDEQARERDRIERVAARRRMVNEHARLGQAMVRLGAQHVARIASEAGSRPLSTTEVARLVDIGTRLEQQARGGYEGVSAAAAAHFVDHLVGIALRFVPHEAQDAFLEDLDHFAGVTR